MTTRLDRGPWVIGEPSPVIEIRLSVADPYRPDTLVDGGVAPGCVVRAASVRGLAKRYDGGARQDDLCLLSHAGSETLLAAVADGVSAATRAEMGAALAVRYAVAAAARQLDSGAQQIEWDDVFAQAAWAVVAEHRRHSGDEDAGVDCAAAALATTLLVAAVDETSVQLAGVGDSPALVLSDGVFTPLGGVPNDPKDSLLGAGVEALPNVTAPMWTARHERAPGEVLLLCTDGLALPIGDGTGAVGVALAAELVVPPDLLDLARLLDFSRSTYDDDRTLVAIWPQP